MDNKLIITVIISSFLLVCLVLKFLYKHWLVPISFQRRMTAQDKFIHGNIKEVKEMQSKAMSEPMDFSPKVFMEQNMWYVYKNYST